MRVMIVGIAPSHSVRAVDARTKWPSSERGTYGTTYVLVEVNRISPSHHPGSDRVGQLLQHLPQPLSDDNGRYLGARGPHLVGAQVQRDLDAFAVARVPQAVGPGSVFGDQEEGHDPPDVPVAARVQNYLKRAVRALDRQRACHHGYSNE